MTPGTDFEQFLWKGQLRYKCNCLWESGAPCEYDTYDLAMMADHLRGPHRRRVEKKQGKAPEQAAPKQPVRPPLYDGSGNPIVPNERESGARFKI